MHSILEIAIYNNDYNDEKNILLFTSRDENQCEKFENRTMNIKNIANKLKEIQLHLISFSL